jgi:hypothetical protein
VRKLNVSLLCLEEVDHAFPLIRTVCPEAELDSWRRFAQRRLAKVSGNETGILVVKNEQDCIVGIGAFLLSDGLQHGPVLFADHFCALDIVGQASVARVLEDGIEKIARRHHCVALHTTIAASGKQADDGWLCAILHERGHRIEGLHLCKLLPGSA